MMKPTSGEMISDKAISTALPQLTPSLTGRPVSRALTTATPRIAPISACELDAGMPKYQVPRFQAMAAISIENTIARLRPLPRLSSRSTGIRWTMA